MRNLLEMTAVVLSTISTKADKMQLRIGSTNGQIFEDTNGSGNDFKIVRFHISDYHQNEISIRKGKRLTLFGLATSKICEIAEGGKMGLNGGNSLAVGASNFTGVNLPADA